MQSLSDIDIKDKLHGDIIPKSCKISAFIYLRNKETQQTLWGIVDWLCNARLSCIPSYYMKAVSKGQDTAGLVTISVTYA